MEEQFEMRSDLGRRVFEYIELDYKKDWQYRAIEMNKLRFINIELSLKPVSTVAS